MRDGKRRRRSTTFSFAASRTARAPGPVRYTNKRSVCVGTHTHASHVPPCSTKRSRRLSRDSVPFALPARSPRTRSRRSRETRLRDSARARTGTRSGVALPAPSPRRRPWSLNSPLTDVSVVLAFSFESFEVKGSASSSARTNETPKPSLADPTTSEADVSMRTVARRRRRFFHSGSAFSFFFVSSRPRGWPRRRAIRRLAAPRSRRRKPQSRRPSHDAASIAASTHVAAHRVPGRVRAPEPASAPVLAQQHALRRPPPPRRCRDGSSASAPTSVLLTCAGMSSSPSSVCRKVTAPPG